MSRGLGDVYKRQIEDASGIIGIILVVIGIILAAAVVAMIILTKRSKK